jgi:hypothetical protein
MAGRRQRLAKLVGVQQQLKAFHEARHASLAAAAIAAGQEARDIATRFDDPASLAALFPDVYHARIADALDRERSLRLEAEKAAGDIAVANARGNVVERNYRDALRQELRHAEERERLDLIQDQRRPPAKD